MTRIKDALSFHLYQSDHLVLNNNPAAKTRLDVVSRIVLPSIGTQVNDRGMDGQIIMLNGATNIHATGHRRVGAVSDLKFSVDQYFFHADSYADEIIGMADRGYRVDKTLRTEYNVFTYRKDTL